jgi:hypothetical protein
VTIKYRKLRRLVGRRKMTPEEILGKFVSGRMMVKKARYVDDALNGPMPI